MARIVGTKKVVTANGKITKRDLLVAELSEVLSEHFDQEVKFTKEGIVLVFTNEKEQEKDFVFKVIEKKDRVVEEDFLD